MSAFGEFNCNLVLRSFNGNIRTYQDKINILVISIMNIVTDMAEVHVSSLLGYHGAMSFHNMS